jgi:hypothetical protein
MTDFVLSAATFTATLLLFGAWRVRKNGGTAQSMWLMIAASAVIFLNIALWIIPVENGKSLLNQDVKIVK